MPIFTGTGVALATPADENGIILTETEKLVDHVVKGGADALIALGTTGEASTLTEAHKEKFVRFVRSLTDLPLIVGTGGNNTELVAQNCINAEKWGADALLIVTPYYNKCTQEGAIAHYKHIAERVSRPIIVYNVPGRTGFNLLPETMAKLAEVKNIVAVKEASGNMLQIEKYLSLVEADIYCGDDALTVPSMCLGALGVISVAANIVPSLISRMTKLALSGNLQKAGSMQICLLPLIDALFAEVNPIPVRAALGMMGFDMGKPRLPMTELSKDNAVRLKKLLEELNII